MREPEIALAFTPDPWVEALHRHCADHGGARVRDLVLDPATLLDADFDVLVAGHRWTALTPGLVRDVHARSARVLGVHPLDEPAAEEVLVGLGVDAVAVADAGSEALVDAIRSLAPDPGSGRRAEPRRAHSAQAPAAARGHRVVVGGPAGTGRTEVAVELGRAVSASSRVVLVDADEVAPAVAARLGLPIEPNLRTAIDAVEFGAGAPVPATVAAAPRLEVLPGLPNPAAWEQVRTVELERVLVALARPEETTIVVDGAGPLDDVGGPPRGRYALARHLLATASACVAVGLATPTGLTRLLAWLADAVTLTAADRVHVVLNRAPADGYRRAQLSTELLRTFPAASVTLVPADRRVERAAWDGTFVARGPFRKAIAPLAGLVLDPATVARAARRTDDLVPGVAA